MTPEELLLELRDIHLPAAPSGGTPIDLVFEPFLVVAVAVLAAVVIAYRRRRLWRAQARALLREVDREPEPVIRWSRLVALAAATSRRSRAGPPPDCAYLPVERVGSEEIAALRQYVGTALRR